MTKKYLLIVFCISYTFSWGIPIETQGTSLFVQKKKILQILTSKDNFSPLKRIKKIKENLINASLNSQSLIKTINKGNTIHLLANNQLIAIATLQEAKKQKTSLLKLSEGWKYNLIKALYQPPFSFLKQNFFLAEETSLQLKPTGEDIEDIQFTNNTPDIIDINYQENTLSIHSKKIGKGSIQAQLRSHKQILTFEILPLAATIPNEINTYIVGQHSNKTIQKTIIQSIQRTCKTLPLSKTKISFENNLHKNTYITYPIKALVQINAPRAFPVNKSITIFIKNLGMPHKTDKILWYCNYPENIKQFGDISSIHLNSDFPTRILFHHVNRMPHKLGIQFLMKNYSEHPAKLVLVYGEGDPHIDPVKVGQEAAKRFMCTYHKDSADVVEIPAGHEIPLAIHELNPKETISGLASICLLSSGAPKVHITAQAIPTYQLESTWNKSIGKPFPWQTALPIPITREKKSWSSSQHLFPTPHKKLEVKYYAGGPFCFIRLGEIPIRDHLKQKVLEGNFGVTYQIKALVSNPTKQPIQIETIFEASAGYSSGIFIVNHVLKTAPLLLSKQEFLLKKIILQPLENKIINITTIPISGSSYPATIIIRPVSKY